jgi:hypothetical protein
VGKWAETQFFLKKPPKTPIFSQNIVIDAQNIVIFLAHFFRQKWAESGQSGQKKWAKIEFFQLQKFCPN